MTPLITAGIVGKYGFSYLAWAEAISLKPLEIMGIIIRVAFPAFSRLQEERDELKKIVEKSLFMTVLFIYPLLFGILAITPNFIEFMGKEKWQPAIPQFRYYIFMRFQH